MATILSEAGSDVIVFDDLPPEAAAMILALYSRDPRSVRIHREKVAQVGHERFMEQYYVGYGHRSIGDCGGTTICAEYVSMLAAKAIQHNRLYNGQEASTRYLDMAQMPVLNPLDTEEGHSIQETWMTLYGRVLSDLVPYLTEKYPRLETDNSKVYEKAIRARAFDIARAFLPAGCTTFVGWYTNLRQAWDHLKKLSFHPLEEVRAIAAKMIDELRRRYPSSFGFKSYPEQDAYLASCAAETYSDMNMVGTDRTCEAPSFDLFRLIDKESQQAKKLLATRPQKTELPDWFDRFGQWTFDFLLDFGSFRDLQRHRSCMQRMPLLTLRHGIHPWYMDSLPEDTRAMAVEVIRGQEEKIKKIEDPTIRQYYIAMGYRVVCELVAGLPSAVYIAELRSTQAVHPTLRPIAQWMGEQLTKHLPEMALHCDMSPDEWSTIRGKHDIVKKG